MSRTPYLETELLLDILEQRHDDALARIQTMLPHERRALIETFEKGIALLTDQPLVLKPDTAYGLIGSTDTDHDDRGNPL